MRDEPKECLRRRLYDKSFIDQACSIKMIGCLLSFFFCGFMDLVSVSAILSEHDDRSFLLFFFFEKKLDREHSGKVLKRFIGNFLIFLKYLNTERSYISRLRCSACQSQTSTDDQCTHLIGFFTQV